MDQVKVTNIVKTSLAPVVKDPQISLLLPATLYQEKYSFVVEGVSNAVSNGLRRTIANELLIAALYFDYSDYSCTDEFCINTIILNRIRQIVIKQNTPADATFELNVVNKTNRIMEVHTSHLTARSGPKKLPCNENIVICTLEPGKSIKISKIYIVKDYGYNFAGHSNTFACTSIAVDQVPLNTYEGTGISSTVSNPQVWRLTFGHAGAQTAEEIVVNACNNIIERLTHVTKLLDTIVSMEGEYLLKIEGETHTIGNLLMRSILEINPDIKSVVYTDNNNVRRMEIKVICDEDINSLFKNVVKYIINKYIGIRKFFE